MFVDDCASSYMIVATVANSWFTQDPANVTRFGSSYAGYKLLMKSIKKGFDTILKESRNTQTIALEHGLFSLLLNFLFRWIRNLPLFFFVFFLEEDEYFCHGLLAEKSALSQ